MAIATRLSALSNRPASIASEIVQLEANLRYCRESLVHVDATLRLMDPESEPGPIPTKRPIKRVKPLRQSELSRPIMDALRNADEAISTPAIVDHVLAAGGHGEDGERDHNAVDSRLNARCDAKR